MSGQISGSDKPKALKIMHLTDAFISSQLKSRLQSNTIEPKVTFMYTNTARRKPMTDQK